MAFMISTKPVALLLLLSLMFGCLSLGEKQPAAETQPLPSPADNSTLPAPLANSTSQVPPENAAPVNNSTSPALPENFTSANQTANLTLSINLTETNNSTLFMEKKAFAQYFYSEECFFCKNATPYLSSLEAKYPLLQIDKYEIYYNATNFALYERYVQLHNLSSEQQVVPLLYLNATPFIGIQIYESLEAKVKCCIASAEGCRG